MWATRHWRSRSLTRCSPVPSPWRAGPRPRRRRCGRRSAPASWSRWWPAGSARGLAPWRRLAARVAPRPRSVILGMVAALAVLTACGALLAGASLAVHLTAYRKAVAALSPGAGGSALLLLAGLSYLPNSVIWAIAYMLGPGFSFGTGTAVSPSGSALGPVPAFPALAALPTGTGPAFPAWLGFFVLAVPYLAGALAGLMTVRIAPTPFLEAAPLWGLLTGTLAAVVIGFGAKFS